MNEIGVVAPEANLRTAPNTTNPPVKLLQFNTRVQIAKEMDGGWYSISTEDGDTGYVAAHLIKKGLPEPSSRLHKVESGESAIGIAEKYYKSNAAQWGQDLRYYVNVLVYVNKGIGDPSKGIYTASAKDGWKEAQVKSGYYIWIPGVEYAKSLQGVVESGSITYGIQQGIENTIGFFQQKLDDFNYANQFVGKLLPSKLSDNALEAIKSAPINFSLGMIAAGLLLAIAAGLGALIGALVGFFAGGAGAVPGAALGAKIGFEIGLFLLKWIGLGLLITSGASLLGKIGVAFGKYVINVWEASGNRKKLENSADLCAEAMKEFLLGVLELVVMLVAAWGIGRAMGALAKTKFGEKIGYEKLTEWVNKGKKGIVENVDAAAMARSWQGNIDYPGIDNWENVIIRKGTKVWGGMPGPSNFYTTEEVMQSVGNDATKLYQGLQVGKGSHLLFRQGMTQYEVTQDIVVGSSKALANLQYGPGGLDQYFIPNYEKVLMPIKSIIMINR